jgi:hypothetical protein
MFEDLLAKLDNALIGNTYVAIQHIYMTVKVALFVTVKKY